MKAIVIVALCAGCAPPDGDEGDCDLICKSLASCGFLPSELGDGPDSEANCRQRCALSNPQLGEAAKMLPTIEDVATGDASAGACDVDTPALARWCSVSESSECIDVADALSSVFGSPPPIGTADTLVRIAASSDPNGECNGGPCKPNVAPCLEADVGPAAPTKDTPPCYGAPRAAPADGETSVCGLVGAETITVRVESWNGNRQSRDLSCVDALAESVLFTDLPSGPLQAVVEVRGELPQNATIGSAIPVVPMHGLSGGYCWSFRSPTVALTPSSTTDVFALVPHTALHAIGRAWRQADLDAKRQGPPLLFGCEDTTDACINGLDDDGDGLLDCSDTDCTHLCALEERAREDCIDGGDNDFDGLFDCNDPGCVAVCEVTDAACRDGLDDDVDGLADCDDPDCARICDRRFLHCTESSRGCPEAVQAPPPTCSAAADPCALEECAWICGKEVKCRDLVDDDADGLTDAADPDCGRAEDSALDCIGGLGRNAPDFVCDGSCTDPCCAIACE